jgi:hypothetical protein
MIDPDYIGTAGLLFGMIGAMVCCIGTSRADPAFKLNHDIKTSQKGVHMKALTMAFMESFRTFFGEAVVQPWQPLGFRAIFAPWINWKGALQQWLVVHLYLWTFELLAMGGSLISWWEMPIGLSCIIVLLCFLLLVYGTWQFWFAITQRKPIGLPAFPFGFLFSIPIGSFMCFMLLYGSPNPFGFSGAVVGTCLFPTIGWLMTAYRVFERRFLVLSFGLCVVLLSGPVLLLFIPYLILWDELNEEWSSMWKLALPVPIQIMIGICMMSIALEKATLADQTVGVGEEPEEGKGNEEPQEGAQAEAVGKRNVSKESVSTAPTDEENPTADVDHVRDDP